MKRILSAAAFVLTAVHSNAADPPRPTASTGGMRVVLPAVAPAELVAAAESGRFVVQGLAPGTGADQIRAAIPIALHGLVTIRRWEPGQALPYADHLIDRLDVDADVLATRIPPQAELLRVLVPGTGQLRMRKGGQWTTFTKPRPTGFGEATHYYINATGNPVSSDAGLGPATSLQWISQSPSQRDFNSNQLVAGDAYIAADYFIPNRTAILSARSAFNGVARWSKSRTGQQHAIPRNGPVVALDGRVYQVIEEKEPVLIALDAVTGAEVLRFAGALPALPVKGKLPSHPGNLAVFEDAVLLTRGEQVICWDRSAGRRRWCFEGKGRNLAFPAVDPVHRRVGVLVGYDAVQYMHGDRETSFHPDEIVSLNLADGREVWRVPYLFRDLKHGNDTRGAMQFTGRALSAFLWANGAFYMNLSKSLSKAGVDIGAIDAATGRTLWSKPDIQKWAGSAGSPSEGIGTLLAFPHAIVLARSAIVLFDPKNGNSLGEWVIGNSRCDNARGTAHGFFNFGHSCTFDPSGKPTIERREIARNACGGSALPANSMLYFQPQTCGCFAAVRGLLALSRQAVGDPVPDAHRLERGPAYALTPARREGPGDWPALLADARRSANGPPLKRTQPVERWRIQLEPTPLPGAGAEDRRGTAEYNGPISAPVVAGGLVLVAAPENHRIHAVETATGKRRWTATLSGRVDTPPTLIGGRVYAGGRDGWLTCLDLDTGKVIWRFLAARNHRQIGAWGSFESPWPVHGSVVGANGTVVATAGYHPDADGGLHCWGLDAVTGAVRWKRIVACERAPSALDPASTKVAAPGYFTPNQVLNGLPSSTNTEVILPGLRLAFADGTGPAKLGGIPQPKKTGAPPRSDPPDTDGLLVKSWSLSSPWLRSAVGNFGGPGDATGKQGIKVGAANPRRAAWNDRVAVLIKKHSDMFVLFDPTEPIGAQWDRSPSYKIGERVPNVGRVLATLPHGQPKAARFSDASQIDLAALILAGPQAVAAWTQSDPTADGSHRWQNRPSAKLQLLDLEKRTVTHSFEVKPAVIEHGLATAQGTLFMSLEDGSLAAWE